MKLDGEYGFPLPVICQEEPLKTSFQTLVFFVFIALEIYHDFYPDIILNNKTYLSLNWFIRHQLHAGPFSMQYRNCTSYYAYWDNNITSMPHSPLMCNIVIPPKEVFSCTIGNILLESIILIVTRGMEKTDCFHHCCTHILYKELS